MKPRFVWCFALLWISGAHAADLDQIISAALQESGAPSVSVAITQDHKIVFEKAFGAADAHSRYAVGSISKEFTAASLLWLEEQGKLSLDDKVAKYFPDLTRANEVTIREILSHTSGYQDYAPQDYIIPEWTGATTPQAILDQWAKKPLNFDPGTRWQYSNTNYVLAGEIFEKVSGEKLLDFLKRVIFDPLEMTTAGDCSDKMANDAVGYTRYALGPPRVVKREGPGWYFAAGELCMVAADVARWDIGFLEKRILSAHSYEEFTKEVRLADGKDTHYALGLQVNDFAGIPAVYHGGEVSGFLADNFIFPTKNASITVLSNEDGVNLIGPLARKIAAAIFKLEQPADEKPTEKELTQIRQILKALAKGRIDRALFTSNANSYFSTVALGDYKNLLAPLGKLVSVTRESQQLRGGMTHRGYTARFAKKTLTLNVYVMPDGKIEQLLAEGGVS
jgi:CubicO group peptidase (beta-lactamase class C family)